MHLYRCPRYMYLLIPHRHIYALEVPIQMFKIHIYFDSNGNLFYISMEINKTPQKNFCPLDPLVSLHFA